MSRNAWIGLIAVVVAAAIVAAVVLIAFVLTPARNTPPPSPAATSRAPSPTQSAGPPPTGSPIPTPGATPTPTPTRAIATPFITFDSYDAATKTLTVGANVQGIVDQEGQCTLTVSGPGPTASGTFPAQVNASSMDCGAMALHSDSFVSGTWSVSVGYTSPTSAGTVSGHEVHLP